MLPVILPPQSHPVTQGNLLERTWYLFLQAICAGIAVGFELIQYGTHVQRLHFDATDLIDGSLWVETDTGTLYQWDAPQAQWAQVGGGASGTDTAGTIFTNGLAVTVGAVPIGGGPTIQTAGIAVIVGTVYHNTTAKPIWVNVIGPGAGVAVCDGGSTPTTVVAATSYSLTGSGDGTLSFIVLPGFYWQVTGLTSIFGAIEWT